MSRLLKMLRRALKACFARLGYDVHPIVPGEQKRWAWLAARPIATVFDIGANTGQFAELIHGILPAAAIYSFEPLADCHRELVARLGALPRFRAFAVALGDEEGERDVHRSRFSPSSSFLVMGELHEAAFPFTAGSSLEKVRVRRLDSLVADLGREGVSLEDEILVKIDVQGFEDRVIRGGRELLARARVLIVEVSFEPLYEEQPLFAEIHGVLAGMGFTYRGNMEQLRDPRDGRALQADAVFTRS